MSPLLVVASIALRASRTRMSPLELRRICGPVSPSVERSALEPRTVSGREAGTSSASRTSTRGIWKSRNRSQNPMCTSVRRG